VVAAVARSVALLGQGVCRRFTIVAALIAILPPQDAHAARRRRRRQVRGCCVGRGDGGFDIRFSTLHQ
jgi:hypothetical protein